MNLNTIGLATLHTRVERWECDFNDHWNARFYGRSFQLAAEHVAMLEGRGNPGLGAIATRHVRYHRESFLGDAVEVRSVRVTGGAYDGSVVHLLHSGARLAATALDRPGAGAAHLPAIAADDVTPALPRSTFLTADLAWDPAAPDAFVAETGVVRPFELDHAGSLLYEEIVRRTAIASQTFLSRLGYTPEFTKTSGVGRMAIESRVTLAGRPRPGSLLTVRSRLSAVARKSFSTKHWLDTEAGDPVASIDHTVVAVDMTSRRATDVPDFIKLARP